LFVLFLVSLSRQQLEDLLIECCDRISTFVATNPCMRDDCKDFFTRLTTKWDQFRQKYCLGRGELTRQELLCATVEILCIIDQSTSAIHQHC
jgi:hypothetical protein